MTPDEVQNLIRRMEAALTWCAQCGYHASMIDVHSWQNVLRTWKIEHLQERGGKAKHEQFRVIEEAFTPAINRVDPDALLSLHPDGTAFRGSHLQFLWDKIRGLFK